jgi:hypothetical protein
VPVANGRFLAERIAGARLIVHAGVGRIPEVVVAERRNADLIEFLAREASPRAQAAHGPGV